MGKQPLTPSEKRPLMAVDLDGTYITGNSLRLYAACALRAALRRGRVVSALRMSYAMFMRRLKLTSHIAMKNAILRLASPDATMRSDFCRRFEAMINPDVRAVIDGHRSRGYEILLATAASEIYVRWIWSGPFVATAPLSADECRGVEKLRRVLAYADEHSLQLRCAVTDHADDIPLLSYPALTERILVRPDAATLKAMTPETTLL